MFQHLQMSKRVAHVINMDPAAESFKYKASLDIQDLITVPQVMTEQHLGPNGALIYCMEYLMSNQDWLEEQLGDYDDDYLLVDLPGQIELFTHMNMMRDFAHLLQDKLGYKVCALFLIDSHFITDAGKYVSGCLSSLSSMIQLEVPFLTLLTKCDLLRGQKGLDTYLDVDTTTLRYKLNGTTPPSSRFPLPSELDKLSKNNTDGDNSSSSSSSSHNPHKQSKYTRLNEMIIQILEDFPMTSFTALDVTDEQSLNDLLLKIDMTLQYGEGLRFLFFFDYLLFIYFIYYYFTLSFR